MKKMTVFFVLMCTSLVVLAQDVILTSDNSEIQAQVLRINEENIEYKKWNYLEGPTFVISVGNVVSIKYANGDIEEFGIPQPNNQSHSSNNAENNMQFVSADAPLSITKVEVCNTSKSGNVLSDYGETLFSDNTNYIQTKITCIGLITGNIELKTKVFNGNGQFAYLPEAPEGFSQAKFFSVTEGESLVLTFSGIGTSPAGYWKPGAARVEIWYEDRCLATRDFEIVEPKNDFDYLTLISSTYKGNFNGLSNSKRYGMTILHNEIKSDSRSFVFVFQSKESVALMSRSEKKALKSFCENFVKGINKSLKEDMGYPYNNYHCSYRLVDVDDVYIIEGK